MANKPTPNFSSFFDGSGSKAPWQRTNVTQRDLVQNRAAGMVQSIPEFQNMQAAQTAPSSDTAPSGGTARFGRWGNKSRREGGGSRELGEQMRNMLSGILPSLSGQENPREAFKNMMPDLMAQIAQGQGMPQEAGQAQTPEQAAPVDFDPAAAVQNPFESFRRMATGAASKIAGLDLGEDMIGNIFQGKSPQDFFTTVVAPFALSAQLNNNRGSLIEQFLGNPWGKEKKGE